MNSAFVMGTETFSPLSNDRVRSRNVGRLDQDYHDPCRAMYTLRQTHPILDIKTRPQTLTDLLQVPRTEHRRQQD